MITTCDGASRASAPKSIAMGQCATVTLSTTTVSRAVIEGSRLQRPAFPSDGQQPWAPSWSDYPAPRPGFADHNATFGARAHAALFDPRGRQPCPTCKLLLKACEVLPLRTSARLEATKSTSSSRKHALASSPFPTAHRIYNDCFLAPRIFSFWLDGDFIEARDCGDRTNDGIDPSRARRARSCTTKCCLAPEMFGLVFFP
jgi:hypothetical protein